MNMPYITGVTLHTDMPFHTQPFHTQQCRTQPCSITYIAVVFRKFHFMHYRGCVCCGARWCMKRHCCVTCVYSYGRPAWLATARLNGAMSITLRLNGMEVYQTACGAIDAEKNRSQRNQSFTQYEISWGVIITHCHKWLLRPICRCCLLILPEILRANH